MVIHYLSKLFEPASIAVVGANNQPDSIGCKVFKNLLSSDFAGPVYAVNPRYKIIQNKPCYPNIGSIKGSIDLAVIATPANTIPKIITECGNKGIHHVIILSAGFSETGLEGKVLEQHIYNIAKGYHIHILGPHCLGVMRPHSHINATFDNAVIKSGNLAFVSQSDALASTVIDWAADKKIGFSSVITLGNCIDIEFAEVLDYLSNDPRTEHILLYIESIQNARKFMSALRAAARKKPVIILKTGRHPLETRMTRAYTDALVGDDNVFDMAIRRAGAVRVMNIEELFLLAEMLSSAYRVQGNRLLIITNSGGAGAMAADRAIDLNIPLATLTEHTLNELNRIIPMHGVQQNPVDVGDDATPEHYHRVLQLCAEDENGDGILAMLVPSPLAQPLHVAERLVKDANILKKPILVCWMGEKHVKSSWQLFAKYNIPHFDTPEKAVRAFSYLADYQVNQQLLLQVPEPLSPQSKPDFHLARQTINKALKEKRYILSPVESKAILHAFFIPIAPSVVPLPPTNYPAVMIHVIRDSVFGPVIRVGAHHTWIDSVKDKALALPPLNMFIAKQLLEQAHIPYAEMLVDILLKVSGMICHVPEMEETHINLHLMHDQSVIISDARVIINHDIKDTKNFAHMAIHPYPEDLTTAHYLDNKLSVTIRPIRPEDACMTQDFVRNLSAQSKYFRFMQQIRELTPETLINLTHIDYDREMTFVATFADNDQERCIGVSHYITNPDRESCEFAIAVADDWQNKGIGSTLMKALCSEAKAQGLSIIRGAVLSMNVAMLEMTAHLGFDAVHTDDPTVTCVVKNL